MTCCRYTSEMLLAAIDERHEGTYDFVYLPIDFRVRICYPFYLLMFNLCWNSFYLFLNNIESTLIAEQMQCWICIHQHDQS